MKETPNYYIGKHHKYEARKVVEDFELSYNLGTAVTYLLRSGRKHASPEEDIEKAINHLKFELERLKLEENEESNTSREKVAYTYITCE